MAQNGYGPMAGHVGRIPNFGKTQVNPMGHNEPPACIQNAMMTKDKKPFTYTPGGLDLSQIRTPSMARRLARQRSQEEHEQAYAQQYAPQANGNYQPQGIPKPPPPPSGIPAPPPPPPLVITVPDAKSPKPPAFGERPEIVIPENPIGMLRKTNSPYHWESEKADMQRMGPVPKFAEKVPSPLTVKMPPSSFSNQAPQNYTPPSQNTNYSYNNQNKQTPESPIHRPEALYAHQQSNSPSIKTPTIELLQRQDSQFNKSPQPFGGQSPISNGSPYSPSPNNNWRQPDKRDSPAPTASYSPQSPQLNRSPFTPNNQQHSPNYQNQSPPANTSPAFHTLPRAGQRNQEIRNAQNIQSPPNTESNPTPWRTNTLGRQPREVENQNTIYNNQNTNQPQASSPPWKSNEMNNNENTYTPPWLQTNKNQNANQQQYTPPWVTAQDSINNGVQENSNASWRAQDNNNNRAPHSPPGKQASPQEQPRYQSSMSIPVTPRRQNPPAEYNNTPPQKEVVYVNQEPVYFCPDSPNSIPPWVKTQKEKTKTPPPAWVQRPLETRRSASRDLVTPPRDTNQEPDWVKRSNEMQRGIRDVISPPKYQQTAPPSWSTRPSDNRKSLPRDNAPSSPGSRVIPIQMEVSSSETRDQGKQSNQAPHLRIVIGMQPNPTAQAQAAPFSQPTQRIMRVLSPQLVRPDDAQSQPELPALSRHLTSNQDQPKTRIIPIQIEGGNDGANKSFGGRY